LRNGSGFVLDRSGLHLPFEELSVDSAGALIEVVPLVTRHQVLGRECHTGDEVVDRLHRPHTPLVPRIVGAL